MAVTLRHRAQGAGRGGHSIDGLPIAIMSEFHTGRDRQHFGQADSGAIDAAFHSPDRAAANPRCFFVREARGADQNQGFALIARQLLERGTKIKQIHMAALRRGGREFGRESAIRIGDFAPPLAVLRIINIPQNREKPRPEIGSFDERIDIAPGLHQGFLNEIVGAIKIAAKETAKARRFGITASRSAVICELAARLLGAASAASISGAFDVDDCHMPSLLDRTSEELSSCRNRSRKRPGTGCAKMSS